ncbi:MAG TPA: 4Fe-4S dicluster domain-containing protein [Bryobacteraceae bacterium]|nr:4Fe-4S dicluster domain-containing protein [Bryobacteraceae bacterium]
MKKHAARLDANALDGLIQLLRAQGYEVHAPVKQGPALRLAPIGSASDLPAGIDSVTSPGRYRLAPASDRRIFGAGPAADAAKRLLHLPESRFAKAERQDGAFHILQDAPVAAKIALFGIRPCDVAAIARMDRVLLKDRYADPPYQAHRAQSFIVAANCVRSAGTCFCASMETGPRAQTGFDIALTESRGEGGEFLAESGSAQGAAVLAELKAPAADAGFIRACHEQCDAAAAEQTRSVDYKDARRVVISNFEHPRWESAGKRCLACANCTMICPTCFCVTTVDRSNAGQDQAERWRVWDSCFTQSFSYIHGGSVRSSTKSRYRQWLSHKLAHWQDQFGETGCVGCGRCITWCPAGIDITEEYAVLASTSAH